MDLVIASRRVETAICVFGGSLNPKRSSQTSSIFRLKGSCPSKQPYEQRLHQRYRISDEGRISWDVEANPPIDIDEQKNDEGGSGAHALTRNANTTKTTPHVIVDDGPGGKRSKMDPSSPTPSSASFEGADAPKIKYR